MGEKPILGVTMGDPTGAGPEIVVMALCREEIRGICKPLVIGDATAIEAAAGLVGARTKVAAVKEVRQSQWDPTTIEVVDLQNVDVGSLVRGQVDPMGGRAAYQYIQRAAELALDGQIDAMVTGPINKEALNQAGYHYNGHTEILAKLCGVKDVAMMLVAGDLRVSHVTTHVSLREACDLIKRERVLKVIQLTHDALQEMGLADARIAVAGLNPHAGEEGLFGREEIEEIRPAVEKAQRWGWNVVGPIPADTVFFRSTRGQEIGKELFDGVVAMYHDQGHIPIKLLAFVEGVNVTLGLPIIRTSVDHGTVFGKAGKGTADPTSMIEALKLAARMARSNVH
jgi:4-hydroxythreonine-4-phosphate dehydrogenase